MGNRAFICNQQQQAHRRREVVRPRRRLLHLHVVSLEGRLDGGRTAFSTSLEEEPRKTNLHAFLSFMTLILFHYVRSTNKAFAPGVLVSMGNRL